VRDLPPPPAIQDAVERGLNLAQERRTVPDADEDFTDTDFFELDEIDG